MPHFSLELIQNAVRQGRYWITTQAGLDAAALYLDEDDIKACVLALEDRHFYKTMPSHSRPGTQQDVYKCRYYGFAIYTKLQLSPANSAAVISFKRDEDA